MGRGIDGHGPTQRESEILVRSDAGMPFAEIAEELGLSPNYVRNRISELSGSWSANDAFDAMVVRGTQALAAALAKSGGHFA